MTFEDLLGDIAPVRRTRSARRNREVKVKPVVEEIVDRSPTVPDVVRVMNGVSIPWLCKAFGLTRGKVVESLVDCPVKDTTPNGAPKYDLAVAAAYLVKPIGDFEAYLKKIKPNQLPDNMRETYWNARLKEQKFRQIAGNLWPTNKVMEVLGETFKNIRTTTQLWVETIDETSGLTVQQRETLSDLVNDLLDNLHLRLQEQASEKATLSQLEELEDA